MSSIPPQLLGAPPNGQIGSGYAFTYGVQQGTAPPPNTFAIVGGALPPGLSFNTSTGAITGTPTALGTFTFQPQVSDSTNRHSALISQSITITPGAIQQNVVLRWSDDGGHTWSDEVIASAGNIGQTAQRVIWYRLGSTKRNTGLDRIFEVSSADPVQVALIGASINDD